MVMINGDDFSGKIISDLKLEISDRDTEKSLTRVVDVLR